MTLYLKKSFTDKKNWKDFKKKKRYYFCWWEVKLGHSL